MDKEHKGSINYTLDDDGIWLDCSCGFKENLGFSPEPKLLAAKWLEHLDNLEYDIENKSN